MENQVCELDANLLLTCAAARQGLPSIIRAKRNVESRIVSFPRSIYPAADLCCTAAVGFSGLQDHQQAIFEHFQKMIPALEKAFPNYTIVVRSHQVESQDVYLQIADRSQRAQVTNKLYVISWLRASKALIHNGCTSSVEAYSMGVQAVSYRAVQNDIYDFGF